MGYRFIILMVAVFVFVTGCATSGAGRKASDLNEKQMQTLQKMQEQQAKILAFVEKLEPIEHAEVHVGDREVVVLLYFKPEKIITVEQRDEINSFITGRTGISKGNIKLLVKKY